MQFKFTIHNCVHMVRMLYALVSDGEHVMYTLCVYAWLRYVLFTVKVNTPLVETYLLVCHFYYHAACPHLTLGEMYCLLTYHNLLSSEFVL